MSYYRPSYSQAVAMTRGRGYSGSRGHSFRGSHRGNSSWSAYTSTPRGGGSGGGRFSSSYSNPYESRKYTSSSERYNPRHSDDYGRKPPYRPDLSYSSRDRSPDRKRMRTEAPSSHHDSYGGRYSSGRYESGYMERRRSFSSERHLPAMSRRSDFRRPSGPPPPPPRISTSRGGYRGRITSRGSRGIKFRDRIFRRRLVDNSYAVRRRTIPLRTSDYARRLKINKMRSAIARRAKNRSSESDKEDKDSDEKNDEDSPKKETAKEAKEDASAKEETKSETGDDKLPKKTFIKLNCPHCGMKAVTFRKYDMHLSSRSHLISMRKVAIKQKTILQQMRVAQRNTQNELEKNTSAEDLAQRTSFCPLCKLNYKQRKAVHQASEAHKNMKKFLMPFCKICNITFKSPMVYENHCCSIEHIKRKQRVANGDADSAEEDNLEDFTTIDSVGDNDDEAEKTEEVKVNVGIEQIRKIEAYYCDLCKMYLTRGDDSEMPKILTRHCKNRVHIKRFARLSEKKEQDERAKATQTAKDAPEKGEKEKDAEVAKADPKVESSKEAAEASEDKLWADVDKDIGDILAEAESANKSSDEDEDDSHVNAERYDRFKLSEKNGDEKQAKGAENAENGPVENKKVEEAAKESK